MLKFIDGELFCTICGRLEDDCDCGSDHMRVDVPDDWQPVRCSQCGRCYFTERDRDACDHRLGTWVDFEPTGWAH